LKKIAFFYILNDINQYRNNICQVIKQYYKKEYKIVVVANSDDLIEEIDNELWKFEQISFIPHTTYKKLDSTAPIIICKKNQIPENLVNSEFEILINLSDDFPKDYERYKIIIEFVLPDENMKKKSRDHYIMYKKNNFETIHEKILANG
tara:strand:+ start:2366 stop:2812 length:447 start_codon:yes stop_codon:yes gene_type:complete